MALFNILVDIAARTASLETGMKKAVSELEGFSHKVEGVASVMETAFAGWSLMRVGEELIQATERIDALTREAMKAGASVTAFQELAYAAKQSDVSIEGLSTGFKFLSKNIGAAMGQGSAADAAQKKFAEIGVNFAALKKLSPDMQFEAVGQAIKNLGSEAEQNAAYLAFFGRSGLALKPMFEEGAEGVEKLRKAARDAGLILGDTSGAVQAADRIKELKAQWEALTNHLAQKAAPALSTAALMLKNLLGGESEYDKLLKELTSITAKHIANPIDSVERGVNARIDARIKAIQERLAQLRGETARAEEEAKAQVDSAVGKPHHVMTAAEIDEALPQMHARTARLRAYDQANSDFWTRLNAATETGIDKEITQYTTFVAELDALMNAGQITPEVYAARYSAFWEKLKDSTATGAEKVGVEWRKFLESQRFQMEHGQLDPADAAKQQAQKLDEILPLIQTSAKRLEGHVSKFKDTALDYGQATASALESAFAGFFDGTTKGLGGMVSAFAKAFEQILAQAAAKKVLGWLFSGMGGADSAFGGLFSGMGFASGGDPPVGKASLVGENGPELFVPKSAGTIIPNGALAGGGAQVYTVAPVYNISGLGLSYEQVLALMARNNSDLVRTLKNPRLR